MVRSIIIILIELSRMQQMDDGTLAIKILEFGRILNGSSLIFVFDLLTFPDVSRQNDLLLLRSTVRLINDDPSLNDWYT